MQERRTEARGRTCLRGQISFGNRSLTYDCRVRNLSPSGARLKFESAVCIPSEFDLAIRPGDRRRARLIWGDSTEAGVMFTAADAAPARLTEAPRREASLETESLHSSLARRG